MKATFSAFYAETEMERMLRVKTATDGLNTDRLDGRNCIIRMERLAPDNHKVTVAIGEETKLSFGGRNFGFDDLHGALLCNELGTTLLWDSPETTA